MDNITKNQTLSSSLDVDNSVEAWFVPFEDNRRLRQDSTIISLEWAEPEKAVSSQTVLNGGFRRLFDIRFGRDSGETISGFRVIKIREFDGPLVLRWTATEWAKPSFSPVQ